MHFKVVMIQCLALWGWGADLKIQNIFCTSVLNQGLFLIKMAELLILNYFLN